MNKKIFLTGGLATLLTFGGLAGCADGVDQDNGVSDGEQKDQLDQDTEKEAEGTLDEANKNLQEAEKNIEEELKDEGTEAEKNVEDNLKEEGVDDGVDQDNGVSDGEKKDELDNTKP
jgi:hypothetical protein